MSRFVICLTIVLSVVASLGVIAQASDTTQYVVTTVSTVLPVDIDRQVAAAGGVLIDRIVPIGVVVAQSADPDFAATLEMSADVESVAVDPFIKWTGDEQAAEGQSFAEAETDDRPSSVQDRYEFLQWGLDAVGAKAAWAAGHRGAGVRVAVLDSGIAQNHPDLRQNVNQALCASFVPGEDWRADVSYYHLHHGTHVAGIIAATDNEDGYGSIGVAPEAEIVAIKVLRESTNSGAWSWIMQGLVYAADIDADIVNMSLGGSRKRSGFYDSNENWVSAKDVSALMAAWNRAAAYAHDRGVTIIAAAGNDARNANEDKNWFFVPSQIPHVISVSATAPYGLAVFGDVDLDEPATYTNFGLSHIQFAAPGGDWGYWFEDPSSYCDRQSPAGWWYERRCYVFDYVFSTTTRGWWWATGTSMAAPHAAGVAAIIIEMNDGEMAPAEVEAALRRWADDLGKRGKDDYFGQGRVSIGNAFE